MALEEDPSNSSNIPDGRCICGICNKRYIDPRVLPCLHSFCLADIKNLMAENGDMECPACKQTVCIPGKNPHLLHRNIYLSDCTLLSKMFDIITSSPPPLCDLCEKTEENYNISVVYCFDRLCGFMCEKCYEFHCIQKKRTHSHTVFELEEARAESRETLMEKLKKYTPSLSKCISHDFEELSYHCNKCFEPVCIRCLKDHHSKHDYCKVEEMAVDGIKQNFRSIVAELGQENSRVNSAVNQTEVMKNRVAERGEEIISEVNKSFKIIHDQVSRRHEELHARAKEIADGKIKELDSQKQILQVATDGSNLCEGLIKDACEQLNTVQILSLVEPITNRAVHLQEELKTAPTDICETADIFLNLDTESLQDAIKHFGSIEDITPCADECTAIIPSHVVARDTKMLVKLVTRDQQKNQITIGGSIVKGCLQSSNVKIECEVEDCRNGIYKIWLESRNTGKYEFSLTINGHDVRLNRSVFRILPIHEYKTLNVSLQTITTIKKPQSIAFTRDGSMYISSMTDKCVHIYDNTGAPKTTVVKPSALSLLAPCGIDIWNDEILYITDNGSHKIHQYEIGKDSLESICEEGYDVKQLKKPVDVKVSPDGKLFVSDTGNECVQVLNGVDHSFSHAITEFSRDDFIPHGMCFDLVGNLHIAGGSKSDKVNVFSPEGDFLKEYNSGLAMVTGIAIDWSGYSLCVGGTSMSVVDPDGNLVHVVEGFTSLNNVGVSPNGSIWVVSSNANKVSKVAMNSININ